MRSAPPVTHAPCRHSGSASLATTLSTNGKHPMTLHPVNDLFSHPETHDPVAASSSPGPEQPSWTNLFQEPVPAPRASAER
ncbi:hypothetical protein LX90_004088 [Lentzea flava]|nr:hypothetical protein [Lentzea flava]